VLYDGLLFVEDIVSFKYSGLILNAKTGAVAGNFDSTTTPAFADHLGFFIDSSTLTAQSIPSMKKVWNVNFPKSDGYTSPPLVVGSVVYVVTISNTLVGYDVHTGKHKVLVKLQTSSLAQSGSGGLAYGDGELLVPSGEYLAAFKATITAARAR
jgi:outer membrane protein assembly factor BamB